jgi:hypothetical protein
MTFAHKFSKAKGIFKAHGGILNTAKAIRLGIHPKTLYNMRDQGITIPSTTIVDDPPPSKFNASIQPRLSIN